MKNIICVLLSVLLLAGMPPFAFAADGIVIDKTWTILIPESPTAAESFAAGKLRECLSEVFGAQIGVTSSAREKYIAVGSAADCDVSGVADNGYVLPKSDAITVPADTDIVYKPFFESTDTDWKSPGNAEYSMANGLTNGSRRTLTAEMGGTVDYLGGFCHTIGGLCETEKYKDTHPEYLALHDGERTTEQPCLTNPDVLAICTKNVLKILEEKHNPDAPLQIVSVTQNDNHANCQCETCTAFENAHGGKASATVVNFVNQIADVVKEKGYDNVAIDTFAYYYSQSAPEGIVPRDNVIIRLCSITCCFAHPLDTKKCNGGFYKDLTDWAKICKRLYIWDYATNYVHTCTVFPNFGVIQKNMQIFYENNVKGMYVEGNYYMNRCDTEFGELRAYMISKCMQNP